VAFLLSLQFFSEFKIKAFVRLVGKKPVKKRNWYKPAEKKYDLLTNLIPVTLLKLHEHPHPQHHEESQ